MATNPEAMTDQTFYGYMHPLQNRRYYLALVFSILLFPIIAVGLIAGTIVLIVPFFAFLFWVGMRIFFANMLGNSILVSPENYPRINTITEELKAKLGYKKRVYVFVYESGSFNAYMRHIFFRRAIFLNSELLQNGVSDAEVRWLVGRFIGYMRARQQAGVLGWVIRAAQQLLVFNFFILPYERAMVYTGDRIALAEIDGDLSSAISAMQKLLVGRELGYSVNPEGFIAQHRQVKGSVFAFLARLGTGFPHSTARYIDLILFTKAFFPGQFAVFQAENPGLPEDIDRLGILQQTKAGAPIPARAPKGWAWAGGTLVVLLALGLVIWNSVPQGLIADALHKPETSPAAPQPETPPAAAANPQQNAPPHTHFNAAGQLLPDDGCSWMSHAPDDLRVVCTQ
jgi:hypothetical protein